LPGGGSPGTRLQFFTCFFSDKPLPPGSGAAGVHFCNFSNRKYIFVKNGNKKYKNKKTAIVVYQWTQEHKNWLIGLGPIVNIDYHTEFAQRQHTPIILAVSV